MWVKLLQIQRSDLRSNVTVYWNQKKATVFVPSSSWQAEARRWICFLSLLRQEAVWNVTVSFKVIFFFFFKISHVILEADAQGCDFAALVWVPVMPCLRGTSHVYGGRLSSAYGGKKIAAKAFKGVTLTPETFTLGRRVCSPSWRQSGYFILLACMYLENMSTASQKTRKWCSLLHQNSFTDTSSAAKTHVLFMCHTVHVSRWKHRNKAARTVTDQRAGVRWRGSPLMTSAGGRGCGSCSLFQTAGCWWWWWWWSPSPADGNSQRSSQNTSSPL